MLLSSEAINDEEWALFKCIPHPTPIMKMAVHPSFKLLYTVNGESVNKIESIYGEFEFSTVIYSNQITIRCIEAHENCLAIARGQNIELWEFGTCIRSLEHPGSVTSMSWRGEKLASSADSALYLWDPQSGVLLNTFLFDSYVQTVSLSPDQNLILGHCSRKFRIWSTKTGSLLFENNLEFTGTLSCSALGKTKAFFGSSDGTCLTIPYAYQEQPLILRGHFNNIRSVQISKDEHRALSASWDRSVRVWDLETGVPLRVLQDIHDAYVTSVLFLGRDQSWIASISSDKTLKIFDLHRSDRERILALVHKPMRGFQNLPMEIMIRVKTMLFGCSECIDNELNI